MQFVFRIHDMATLSLCFPYMCRLTIFLLKYFERSLHQCPRHRASLSRRTNSCSDASHIGIGTLVDLNAIGWHKRESIALQLGSSSFSLSLSRMHESKRRIVEGADHPMMSRYGLNAASPKAAPTTCRRDTSGRPVLLETTAFHHHAPVCAFSGTIARTILLPLLTTTIHPSYE